MIAAAWRVLIGLMVAGISSNRSVFSICVLLVYWCLVELSAHCVRSRDRRRLAPHRTTHRVELLARE